MELSILSVETQNLKPRKEGEIMKHDDEIYPKIEWTDEMIKNDEAVFDDPKVIEAMVATQETLDEAPFEPPTVH